MEDLQNKPTNEIITELARLEQEIDLKIMKYNLLSGEICKRFPVLNEQGTYTPRVLSKGEIKI